MGAQVRRARASQARKRAAAAQPLTPPQDLPSYQSGSGSSGALPLALLLPPPIARNLLSAPQVRLLAKPIPQACAGCAALTPAPRSRPLAVSSRNAQASARTELQLPSARTISCCSRRCRVILLRHVDVLNVSQ